MNLFIIKFKMNHLLSDITLVKEFSEGRPTEIYFIGNELQVGTRLVRYW